MKVLKISLYIVLFSIMLTTTIWASMHQNLFTEFSWTRSEQWFKATLVDFYINQLILYFGVLKFEKNNFIKIFWFFMFMCFGSMGTCIYLGVLCYKNKEIVLKESV